MPSTGFVLFDTTIGHCGIAWGVRGIVGVQLPEGRETATRARLRQRFPDAAEAPPPREVAGAIDDIVALLRGEPRDLSDIALDMDGVPPFHRQVYEAARTIPVGATAAYGEIAMRAGKPGAARAVGQALGRNPFAIVVPCHRVLAAGGKLGGFSADGGTTTKQRLLAIEGVSATQDAVRRVRASTPGFGFDTEAAVAHLRAADPTLARVIDAAGPFRMELQTTPSVFGALAEAIVYQQLSGKAAATIFGRVRDLFPRRRVTPEHLLSVSEARLRGAGLSRAKLLALRDLARRTIGGEIPTVAAARRLDDETLIERLTAVRGVGRWTAEMFLMFRLGRPDVLPVDDYGIRKGFAVALRKRELPDRQALERRGTRWKPYRTVASWYLWRAADPPARRD